MTTQPERRQVGWGTGGGQQALLHPLGEQHELSPTLAGQAVGQLAGHGGVVEVDEADTGEDGEPSLASASFDAFFVGAAVV